MESTKTSKLIVFLFCIFIYPVNLPMPSVIRYMLIYGLPFFYLLFNINLLKKVTKKQIIIMMLVGILIVFSIIYPFLHSTGDYTYVGISTYVFRKLLIYLALICILVRRYKENVCMEHFLYYYVLTHAIYVLGTICLVGIPGFKNLWFSFFGEVIESGELLKSYGYAFRIGWQGFAGYRMTLHCTFSCLFILYLFYSEKSKLKITNTKFIILYGLCLLGNMFYGRSGLAVTVITNIIAIGIWNRKKWKQILLFFIVILFLFIFLFLLKNNSVISDWIEWIVRPFINLVTTGSFNNYSVNILLDSMFVPEWKTLLLGDGFFTYKGNYYMNVDSGIVRNFLFWGILGAGVSYFTTIYSILEIKKNDKLLCLLMICVFCIFELKGDVYYEFITLFLAISFVETISEQYFMIQTTEKVGENNG